MRIEARKINVGDTIKLDSNTESMKVTNIDASGGLLKIQINGEGWMYLIPNSFVTRENLVLDAYEFPIHDPVPVQPAPVEPDKLDKIIDILARQEERLRRLEIWREQLKG